MDQLPELAIACGATYFSPPPLRAVRGVSLTFEQLQEFAHRVLALQSTGQEPFGWWVQSQGQAQFYTAAAFARMSFDTGMFTALYRQNTAGDATDKPVPVCATAQVVATKWVKGCPPVGVEAAWLLVGAQGLEEDARVVLGIRTDTEDAQDWCVAADWKAESHHESIRDGGENIFAWMPYQVPSASRMTPFEA